MKCNSSSRRVFLKLSGAAAIGPCLQPLAGAAAPIAAQDSPTHRLRIRKSSVELAPGHCITTSTYDGELPGPLLRATVGRPMRIDIYNETDTTEQMNWHGQYAACPDILPRSVQRLEFTPTRSGVYFYHSNLIAAARLDAGLYSGQFGVLLVEPARYSGVRERECVLVLKGYEPFIYRTARGCEIGYGSVTINERKVGHSDSLKTIVHVLNASATDPHTLELPGHSFEVIALDGNPVPSPVRVASLYLSPGERISARVEMTGPAAWSVRHCGGEPWDYGLFGRSGQPAVPDVTLDLELTRHAAARSGFNHWSINGTAFSTTNPRPLFRVQHGLRYHLRIRNTTDEIIPLHLQHHLLQVAGVVKDVVTVGPHQQMEVDFLADSPGRALLYCTRQLHRDFGLMALIDYT